MKGRSLNRMRNGYSDSGDRTGLLVRQPSVSDKAALKRCSLVLSVRR
jgi:hypothetical protein